MLWNVLDTRSVWMKEFAAALAEQQPVRCWSPEYRSFAIARRGNTVYKVSDPPLTEHRFALQRGYGHPLAGRLLPWRRSVTQLIARRSPSSAEDVLVCTAPYYAPIAERWPGKVVYYMTDLTKLYDGADARHVIALDRRMSRVAAAICPNSDRIASYLVNEAGCPRSKITVIPNATRSQNVAKHPLLDPEPAPDDIADLPRPVIGVIGNLAGNIDWPLLRDAIERIKNVSWVFVGPADDPMQSREHREIREQMLRARGRVRFLGPRLYAQLQSYARTFNVALIPYRNVEPTISGSATRFYEHLAACRPILATRAHGELLKKEPLLTLIGSGEEMQEHIEKLRAKGFRDGLEVLRWRVSRSETWTDRAASMVRATHEAVARQQRSGLGALEPLVARR